MQQILLCAFGACAGAGLMLWLAAKIYIAEADKQRLEEARARQTRQN